MLELLLPAFTVCLVLTGILSYLGLHIIEREVIFVDIALAQIAALGMAVGLLMNFDIDGNANYAVALGFTLLGSGIFAMTRFRKARVPQEAIIGVVYTVAAAGAILVLDRSPQGAEHLKSLLVGSILFVNWPGVGRIALLAALIGAVHYVFREKFLLVTFSETEAERRGLSVRRWDFLFYATLGVVVSSAVKVAGVLLVFSSLIVPAVCGALLAEGVARRLVIGWSVGILASFGGMAASVWLDLPTGATIICTFGLILIATGILKFLKN